MVLHVTGALDAIRIVSLELREEIGRVLAQDVDQHVEPTAMGHAQDKLLGPLSTATLDKLMEQRDQGIATLHGEALLAHIAGMEIFLDTLRRRQPLQDLFLARGAKARITPSALQALLEPALLLGIGNMHILRAYRARVHLLEQPHDLAQRQLCRREQRAGMERDIHIGLGQAVIGRLELRHGRLGTQVERVHIRRLVTAEPIGIDQPQDRRLLLCSLCAQGSGLLGRASSSHRRLPALPRILLKAVTNRAMRHIALALSQLPLELAKIGPPVRLYAARILQVGLVQALDKSCIRPMQVRRTQQLLEVAAVTHAAPLRRSTRHHAPPSRPPRPGYAPRAECPPRRAARPARQAEPGKGRRAA